MRHNKRGVGIETFMDGLFKFNVDPNYELNCFILHNRNIGIKCGIINE